MEKTIKILVARFSSIGDIVLCSPIVRCLKEQLSSEVHFITKDKYKDIIETNPYIDKVYSIQNSTSEVFKSLKKEPLKIIILNNLFFIIIKLMSIIFFGVESYLF